MIFKILGSAVALSASVLAAGAVVSCEKRRVTQLSSFARLIELIGRQIESFNASVSEILENTEPSLLQGCGTAAPDTACMRGFLESCELALSEEEKRTLYAFASELGRKFKDEQIRSCSYYAAELGALSSKAAEQLPKKKKMIYTLFVCSALALIIILI